jgi:murein DD-endopeptidase MepM/ murein hydrolase activator NlpD
MSILFAIASGFVAGAVATGLALRPAAPAPAPAPAPTATSGEPPVVFETPAPRVSDLPPRVPEPSRDAERHFGEDTVAELRGRQLTLPVQGITQAALYDSFSEKRDGTRQHEAIDILAPRNTPVVAVEDGTIAKFFVSVAGGNTIYQFDPDVRFIYYYAHLERYADGLKEHDAVRRGQVIGYVGTSGNAPKNTPHLHFAISRLTDKKQWWQGTPLNPYDVLKDRSGS